VRGFDKALLFDVNAPVIPHAQAIGRFGNWFNQELFGRATDLPWGLEIDIDKRPPGYAQFETFHPTFLYESLWNLAVVGIVLFVERHFKLRKGRLFAVYVAAYTFGRFWIERLRIDPANKLAGLRVNEWVSAAVFAGAIAVLVFSGRPKSVEEEPAPSAS
jgi:prolipoprotein diacylglyceryl transferase